MKVIVNEKDWDRIAHKYFQEISSPFSDGVDNPLFRVIEHIPRREQLSVIDLGCGIGNLTPYLCDQFRNVIAIDFSHEMVKATMDKCGEKNNVVVRKEDLRDLRSFYNSVDVAIAVNSIILPSIIETKQVFLQIHQCLRRNGHFIGIFPSMVSDLYRAMLTFDREYQSTGSERLAMKNTRVIMGEKNYDLLFGMYQNHGFQKHFYAFELKYRLEEAGFIDVTIDKVLYPWNQCEDEVFAHEEKPRLFDWFVVAGKPA
jgi:trans-aconitate methyltransferase